jgi:hypothetical protein
MFPISPHVPTTGANYRAKADWLIRHQAAMIFVARARRNGV